MERSKMEEEFRAKLNQREIDPTPHAWDRLDAMLNEGEDKKTVPVRRLNWLYVAAGFLGFILVATLFFAHQNDGKKPETSVAVENVREAQPAKQESIAQDTTNIALPLHPKTEVVITAPKTEKEIPQPNNVQKPQIRIDKMQSNESTVADNENPKIQQKPEPKVTNPELKINTVNADADEQIAEAGNLKTQKASIKVDPNSLLSQVDGELDLTFREKVLKAVNKNYKTVKVALANRNNKDNP